MRLILPILLTLAMTSAAMSQDSLPNAAPWDREFLPPVPDWSGASEALMVAEDHPWVTHFELSRGTSSPTYEETRAWFERAAAASDLVRIEVIGISPEGRDIFAVIVSRDGATLDPQKPVLLVQSGIHPGEIDGNDASQMLLRDIVFGDRGELIDRVNLVLVPILSVDGHARASAHSRPNQRGPEVQGWRHTARNLNLNRDFMKLDSPELRAVFSLIQRYPPALYLDVHVTDGVDYQYDITYGFEGEQGRFARSPAIGRWLDQVWRPRADAALAGAGHIPGPLVFAIDDREPRRGLSVGMLGERFSNGWGDAAHIPTVLVENHSLKPFRQRVLGTYVLIEQSLVILAEDAGGVRAAIASDRALRPARVPGNWRPDEAPSGQMEGFLGIRFEMYDSAVSGRQEVRWLGEPDPEPWTMPLYGSSPGRHFDRPSAYLVPATHPEIIERLRAHGIEMQVLDAPATIEAERLRLGPVQISSRVSEGRVPMSVEEVTAFPAPHALPAGSVRVPTDQPLGDIVVLLLEPQSSESFFAWGMFAEVLQRVEYIEGYAIAPLAEAMLEADAQLRADFEARLASDEAFRNSPDARLQWFYERTPFYDDRFRLYPISRVP